MKQYCICNEKASLLEEVGLFHFPFKEVAKMNVAETRHQAFKAPLAFE